MQQLMTSKAYEKARTQQQMVSQQEVTGSRSTADMMFENQIKKKNTMKGTSPTKLLAKSVSQKSPYKRNQDSTYVSQSAQAYQASPRRSPKKKGIIGYEQSGPFDPELNRAVARQMYVDSAVNVVYPSANQIGAKVKPG